MKSTSKKQQHFQASTASSHGGEVHLPPLGWRDALILVALSCGFLIVLGWRMDEGVMPHDSGTLAQSAERVLNGELPHHDFQSPYTGLLSQMHAIAFEWFGINLLTMRYVLLAFSELFIVGLYVLLRQALPPAAATLAILGAFMWSLPNYFAPMPTWYNLFFTTFGLLAMLRFVDVERWQWLVLAGVCAGISFLFKSVGVYFVAATLTFFVYREQLRTLAQRVERVNLPSTSAGWSMPIWAGLGLLAYMIVAIVGSMSRLPAFVAFAMPPLIVLAAVAWNEWRLRDADSRGRLRRVVLQSVAFLGGALIPVGIFLIPFVMRGALGDWYEGVFVIPQQRLHTVEMSRTIDSTHFMVGGIAAGITAGIIWAGVRFAWLTGYAAVLLLVTLGAVVLQGDQPAVYPAVWECVRLIPLILAVSIAWKLLTINRDDPTDTAISDHWQKVFLVIVTAIWFAMVQFPVSHGVYLLYAVPLIVAGVAYAASTIPTPRRWPFAFTGVFLVIFSSQWVITNLWPAFGDRYLPPIAMERLNLERGPVQYDPATKRVYETLIREIQRHSPDNSYILALPDSPEVYFLSGRRNPTPTFFDAFDADYGSVERDQRLLKLIDDYQINLIVLRNLVSVSTEDLNPRFLRELEKRFPHEYAVQNYRDTAFLIRWRDPPQTPSQEMVSSEKAL